MDWWLQGVPAICCEAEIDRFRVRQEITRLTYNRYRSMLANTPPDQRPTPPNLQEALQLSKRKWERLFLAYRTQLRDLQPQYGDPDESLDAMTVDFKNALDIEATTRPRWQL
jgi:hypothetical protein